MIYDNNIRRINQNNKLFIKKGYDRNYPIKMVHRVANRF